MKCLRTRSESLKKCFLLCEMLFVLLIFAGCSADPVYIGDEIDVDELWTPSEAPSVEEYALDTEPEWDGVTVYYTESGSVWHITPECSALKRAEIILSGTKDQAQSAGKERACKKCS